ncbi:hypothetical protein K490DRAFT_63220 [Saccharata proteae CBS 121410]|uniref:Uncharacterized protein n=1 Tax=Saccharata proteae CBS 121410 TaxID=1314787 RepID=A0A9P4LX88_9PEZI|nr:hypothetical protein K490DRAFT_63220 [Saccharata proteae CBS 121410]
MAHPWPAPSNQPSLRHPPRTGYCAIYYPAQAPNSQPSLGNPSQLNYCTTYYPAQASNSQPYLRPYPRSGYSAKYYPPQAPDNQRSIGGNSTSNNPPPTIGNPPPKHQLPTNGNPPPKNLPPTIGNPKLLNTTYLAYLAAYPLFNIFSVHEFEYGLFYLAYLRTTSSPGGLKLLPPDHEIDEWLYIWATAYSADPDRFDKTNSTGTTSETMISWTQDNPKYVDARVAFLREFPAMTERRPRAHVLNYGLVEMLGGNPTEGLAKLKGQWYRDPKRTAALRSAVIREPTPDYEP